MTIRTILVDDEALASQLASVTRALSFFDSATASSRSKDRASAALARALSKSSGREPGTKSLLRMLRTRG